MTGKSRNNRKLVLKGHLKQYWIVQLLCCLSYLKVTQQSAKCSSESSVPFICCHGWTSQPTPLVQWIIIIPALWRFFSWIIALSLLHHSFPVFLRSFLAAHLHAVLSDVFKKITTPSSYQPFALLPFIATFLKICLYSLSIPHFPFVGRNWLYFNPF